MKCYKAIEGGASLILFGIMGVFLASILFHFTLSAPVDFPIGKLLSVERDVPVSGVAQTLKDGQAIHSTFVFRVFVALFGSKGGVMAGDYALNKKQSVYSLAYRLVHAQYELKPVKITIPEGLNVAEIGKILSDNLYQFDAKKFSTLASEYEGYLFPNTYFFLPTIKPDEVIRVLNQTFKETIKPIELDMRKSKHTISDIVTMASILEEESRGVDMPIVAGILWRRLSIGMPLQVDATFVYVNGKRKSSDLTMDDLKIDSPYNTYVRKGLPPTPISNPGLAALRAAINPTEKPYYFYLTGRDGKMHYAVTFDEHVANKIRYLY